MTRGSIIRVLAVCLALMGAARASAQGLLNLSCMQALAAVGEARLGGIFSFIPDKDSSAAFADLYVHLRKVKRKFQNKLSKDLRQLGGISLWDRQVVMRVLDIYASPLVETLEKPSEGELRKLKRFSLAPTMTLHEMTIKRRKGGN